MNKNLYNMRPNYDGLSELIDYISKNNNLKNLSMIEIGSYSGQSTIFFAKYFQSVISIDPFIDDYDSDDPTCNFASLNYVYDIFKENIKPFTNIIHIKKSSNDAVKNIDRYIKKSKLYMVYIDGLHTYDQVKKDINNYSLLLKHKSFLCGHDYDQAHKHNVVKAVNEYKKPDKIFSDSSWAIEI